MRYPNKSLESPLETFSKVALEKLLWAMLHQLGGKPPDGRSTSASHAKQGA